MKFSRKVALWTSITCGFLAGILSFSEPLKLNAATLGKYISDVIVITDQDIEKAKNENWTVMDQPLVHQYVRKEILNESVHDTYLAYKTTNKPEESVTEMKFMNMYGGWSFSEYEKFLEDSKEKIEISANAIYPAVEGFRKYYAKGTKQAKSAYEALNLFLFDEFDGLDSDFGGKDKPEGGLKKKMGDLLLDETLVTKENVEILSTLLLEGNSQFVDTMLTALNLANIKNDDGKTFLDCLKENKGNFGSFIDRTDLNACYADFQYDINRMREDIKFYNNNPIKFDDFETEVEAHLYARTLADEDFENGTDFADMWMNAPDEIRVLSSIEYSGIGETSYKTLLDLIMDEEAPTYQYYPIFGYMTPGVRATSLMGLATTLSNSIVKEEDYDNRIEQLKNCDPDLTEILENEGVSVFFDVDRSLYREGNVAMTTDADFGTKKGDLSWQKALEDREKLNEEHTMKANVLLLSSCGIFAFAATDFLCISKGIFNVISQLSVDDMVSATFEQVVLTEIREPITVEQFLTMEIDDLDDLVRGTINPTYAETTVVSAKPTYAQVLADNLTYAGRNSVTLVKCIFSWTVILAVIALFVTLALFIVNILHKSEITYLAYEDIPGILCHYQKVYDMNYRNKLKPDNEYVYYYGAVNPFSEASEAKYGNSDDGTKKLGENRRNVQDIYNWELGPGRNREWGCLYYTKDRRAGYPILRSSLEVIDGFDLPSNSERVLNFDDDYYDLNSILSKNAQDDKDIMDEYKAQNDAHVRRWGHMDYRWLLVRHDTSARYPGQSRFGFNNAVGSAVENVFTWGIALVALGIGVVGGIFIGKSCKKKKIKDIDED